MREISAPHAQRVIIHPSGSFLLIDQRTRLLLVPLPGGEPRPLFLGGKRRNVNFSGDVMRHGLARMDTDAFEASFRAEMEKNIAKAEVMFTPKTGTLTQVDEAARLKIREGMEKQISAMREGWAKARRGDFGEQERAVESVNHFSFSDDGGTLFCATDICLRIYDWQDIVGGDPEIRRPKYSFQGLSHREDGSGFPGGCFAFAEDVRRRRLLFGGPDSHLYSLNLEDGSVTSFREMPDREAISSIASPPTAPRSRACAARIPAVRRDGTERR